MLTKGSVYANRFISELSVHRTFLTNNSRFSKSKCGHLDHSKELFPIVHTKYSLLQLADIKRNLAQHLK